MISFNKFPSYGSGLTSSNYSELSRLYEKYKDQGMFRQDDCYLLYFWEWQLVMFYLVFANVSSWVWIYLLVQIILFLLGTV